MADTREIICIQCPMACHVQLTVNEAGDVVEVAGFQCKEGKLYAQQEYKSPCRVLTTTVRTGSRLRPVLPVRSKEPLPKDMLFQCMQYLDTIKVKAPLRVGDLVVSNILSTGVDIISTDDLAV
jgi:CxxC motif-containing protein